MILIRILLVFISIFCYYDAYAEGKRMYLATDYGVGIALDMPNYDPDLKKEKLGNSQVLGLAFGYRYDNGVLAEFGVNHFHNYNYSAIYQEEEEERILTYVLKQKICANAVFGNLYLDSSSLSHSASSKFFIYAGLGIGISKNYAGNIKIDLPEADAFDMVAYKEYEQIRFAWNVGAGIVYRVNDRVDLNLANFKYYNLGQFSAKADEEGEIMKTNLGTYTVSIGIRIKF